MSKVEAEDVNGVDGQVVLVTVTLKSPGADGEWDADEFLALRREARTVAFEELAGQDVRVVYEEERDPSLDEDDSTDAGSKGAVGH